MRGLQMGQLKLSLCDLSLRSDIVIEMLWINSDVNDTAVAA